MSISFNVTEVRLLIDATLVVDNGTEGQPSWIHAVVVERAWHRFEREFDALRKGARNLRAVREYHRLLLEELSHFEKALIQETTDSAAGARG